MNQLGQEERFLAEQREISHQLWQYREELLNNTSLPDPPSRRWHYLDFFGDSQGPFNMSEMKERLGSKVINENSTVVVNLGQGDLEKLEKETLCNLFRSPEAAFVESPRLTKLGGQSWYYIQDKTEVGPFSNEQMKAWFDGGFFGGENFVRLANLQSTPIQLKAVYPSPSDAFSAPPALPGADTSVFTGAKTKVLERPQGLNRSTPEPADRDQKKVQFMLPSDAQGSSDDLSSSGSSAVKAVLKTKEKSGTKSEHMVIYGSEFPPYKKLPSPHGTEPKEYVAALYQWVSRPQHPDAGTTQFYIRREIDGARVNFNKYILFLEETNMPILAAFRTHSGLSSVYRIMLCATGRLQDCNSKALQIAAVELNFTGSQFLLHNSVKEHRGTPRDFAAITYEKNRMSNKGPRKMKVGVPMLRKDKAEFEDWEHEGFKSAQMLTSLKNVSSDNLVTLINKAPRWNEKKKAYMLDFKGRVTRSSVKNFQLVDPLRDPDNKNVIMQHGRTGVNRFSMDISHPLSVVQAFAIALSSLHSKKAVD